MTSPAQCAPSRRPTRRRPSPGNPRGALTLGLVAARLVEELLELLGRLDREGVRERGRAVARVGARVHARGRAVRARVEAGAERRVRRARGRGGAQRQLAVVGGRAVRYAVERGERLRALRARLARRRAAVRTVAERDERRRLGERPALLEALVARGRHHAVDHAQPVHVAAADDARAHLRGGWTDGRE